MTNAWASSPSPSLDAMASESSSVLLMGWQLASTLPHRLWDAYVAYLWYYEPNSWVGRVASTFRILAFVLVLPVVVLTLLDVTSYVIARTLGVVDDVKASTSDADGTSDGAQGGAIAVGVSGALLVEGPARGPDLLAPEDADGDRRGYGVRAVQDQVGQGKMEIEMETRVRSVEREVSSHAYYVAGEDNLRLAGEGVFSPAVSGPPSPLTPRMPLHAFTEGDSKGSGQVSEEEGTVLRRRVRGAREDEQVYT